MLPVVIFSYLTQQSIPLVDINFTDNILVLLPLK